MVNLLHRVVVVKNACLIYTIKCKTDSYWEAAAEHREISSVLCDHLEGWDREGGRETQEGGDMGI